MNKRIIRNRRTRYGGMTVLLTVLLITVVVLVNSLFTTLAQRYSWYVNLNRTPEYPITESCYSLLGSVLSEADADVEIIFCDTEKNLLADPTSKYVYENAKALAERFPEQIRVSTHNIWLNPTSVSSYTETLNPATGETMQTALKSTSVIIDNKLNPNFKARVYDITEFFVFADGDTSQLWAYNGEKKLAAGILRAVDSESAVVGLTNNHGEVFYDYELLYLLDDAGYSIRYFNLYTDPIPEGCSLVITYNPNSDLTVQDGASESSEVDALNAFLNVPGNAYLVFIENGTPALPNLEAFLGEWGVETMYSKQGEYAHRYMVQDMTQSLTSDGYTIYGKAAETGSSADWISGLSRGTVFKNATALRAANGFTSNGDGSYTKENRTVYSLFTGGDRAVSWANGKPVDDSTATLFALTEQTNGEGKSSYVGVCASVDVVSEEFLQSAVHGNPDTMMRIFESLGKKNTPFGLTIKPFGSTDISSVTTVQMWSWTVTLALIPAVTVTVIAWVVLAKRRRR